MVSISRKNGCQKLLDLKFGPILVLILLAWKVYYLIQDFILFTLQSLSLREESESC